MSRARLRISMWMALYGLPSAPSLMGGGGWKVWIVGCDLCTCKIISPSRGMLKSSSALYKIYFDRMFNGPIRGLIQENSMCVGGLDF